MDAVLAKLWKYDAGSGDDRRFREQIFTKLPYKLHSPIAERYDELCRESPTEGTRNANLFLLDVVDAFGGAVGSIADSDTAVRGRAESRAADARKIAARCRGSTSRAATELLDWARNLKIRVRLPSEKDKGVTPSGIVGRLCSETWWRHQLRKEVGRKVEGAAIRLGVVHTFGEIYASNATVARRREQRKRNRATLEALQAVNELGDRFNLAELADLSISNPKLKRSELMVRMAGFEQTAQSIGHVAEFFTWTAPSKMHSVSDKYAGYNPRDTHQYLTRQWARARAALDHAGLKVYGFRVCEPHGDGTPHWHFLLFMPADMAESVGKIMKRYAYQVDPDEPGAALHRFKAVRIDWSRGTATGYVAKYIAKNIDGFGVGVHDEDLTGTRSPGECAARVDAWASTWGIRQFQQIGGPAVTVWRELRRLRGVVAHEALEHARSAADAGNWRRFIEVLGGPLIPRRYAPVWLLKTPDKRLNQYGEPRPARTVGVEVPGLSVLTRRHDWKITHGHAQRPLLPEDGGGVLPFPPLGALSITVEGPAVQRDSERGSVFESGAANYRPSG
jgi:hypothetical protein